MKIFGGLSREEAIDFVCDERFAVISITDPRLEAPVFEGSNLVAHLWLSFHDVDRKEYAEEFGFTVFTIEMAQCVKEFLTLIQVLKTETLIIHCEAGVSRSAGMGAAINKFLNSDDEWYFKYKLPNRLVYVTMLNVLCQPE